MGAVEGNGILFQGVGKRAQQRQPCLERKLVSKQGQLQVELAAELAPGCRPYAQRVQVTAGLRRNPGKGIVCCVALQGETQRVATG